MPEEETLRQHVKRPMWAVEPASSTPKHTSQGYRGGRAGGRTSSSLPGHKNSHSQAPGQWLFPPVCRITRQRLCEAVCVHVCGAQGGTHVRTHRICTFPSLFWCTWSREAPAAIQGIWLEVASGTSPIPRESSWLGLSGLSWPLLENAGVSLNCSGLILMGFHWQDISFWALNFSWMNLIHIFHKIYSWKRIHITKLFQIYLHFQKSLRTPNNFPLTFTFVKLICFREIDMNTHESQTHV